MCAHDCSRHLGAYRVHIFLFIAFATLSVSRPYFLQANNTTKMPSHIHFSTVELTRFSFSNYCYLLNESVIK